MKKQLALLIALLLVSQALLACGENESNVEETDGDVQTTTAETEAELSDDLPDMDFGGESFTFLTSDVAITQHAITAIHEQTGDVLNDAMYERTKATEEKYNIVFTDDVITSSSGAAGDALKNAVNAGDDSYDIAMMQERLAFSMTHEGYFQNIAELPNINFEKPYWYMDINNVINFSDNMFLSYGSVVLSLYDMTHVLLFNRDMITDLQLESPYNLVLDGTWTMDVFTEMANTAKRDLDGDGVWGNDDIYGCVGATNALPMNFLAAARQRTIETSGRGEAKIMLLDNPLIEEIFTNMQNTFWNTGFWYTKSTDSNSYWKTDTYFQEDKALFADHTFYTTIQLRDMESDFGIIPFPKYDENQAEYGVMVEAGIRVMTVPATNNNAELTGAVMETLNFLSYRDVMPAYYETTLKQKVSRDDISSRMLDIIMDSIYYDLGATMFCNQIKDSIFAPLFQQNRLEYVSTVTAQMPVIESAITNARGE